MDQNLFHSGTAWVFNGKGDDMLTHVSDLYFPPENDVDAVWTHSSVAGAFRHDQLQRYRLANYSAHPIAYQSSNPRSKHFADCDAHSFAQQCAKQCADHFSDCAPD